MDGKTYSSQGELFQQDTGCSLEILPFPNHHQHTQILFSKPKRILSRSHPFVQLSVINMN